MQNALFAQALASQMDESGKYVHSTIVDFDARIEEVKRAAKMTGVDPVSLFAANMSIHTEELYDMIKRGDVTEHTPSAWSDIITKHVNDLIGLRVMVGEAFDDVKERIQDLTTAPYSDEGASFPATIEAEVESGPPKAVDYDAPPPGTS